jgi:putative ABC transport system ATP-binding protein
MVVVIETANLEKSYILGTVSVHALCGVNIKIEKGEFVAILGPSGSGKSTLLNMLGALDIPSTGSVKIGMHDVISLNDSELALLRRKIGIVFQFFNLIGRFNALENVELPLAIANISRSKRRGKAEELLDLVGLKDRMMHKPAELSGGERQRVAIARALATSPDFLLLDEPTGNIDSKTARELMTLVKDLNKSQGVTIVMVTHDQNMAEYATRVLYLLDGKITKEVKKISADS